MLKKIRSAITILGLALLIYVFLYGFYLSLSVGIPSKTVYLQSRRYIPCALAASFAVALWRTGGLSARNLWPHTAVSLAWILTYPLSYWIPYHLNTNFIDNHHDIAIGAYLFCFMVCFHLLLLRYLSNRRLTGYIMGVLQTLLLVLPIIQVLYFAAYGTPVSPAACLALLQTNTSEAREFVMQYIGYSGISFILFLFAVLLYVLIRGNMIRVSPSAGSERKQPVLYGRKMLAVTILLFLASGFYGFFRLPRTGALDALYNAKDYLDNANLFNELHVRNLAGLEVVPPSVHPDKPHSVIMVIGESASRYFMSAYRKTERDNSPWMRMRSSDKDFILFRHAYTSWGQTVPALERALTEKNQYNTKEFHDSLTVIDLAKKAGYETWWFSGQGTIDTADTPVTLVAKTADHSYWLEDTLLGTDQKKYDGDLLPYLEKVDPSKNNFIVFHIMGSHDNFINRYPPEFTRWKDPKAELRMDEYDNSLAYTDWFLERVYAFGVKNLNLQAMLYFSDHGLNPIRKRHPELSDFISLRVPLFLYLSPEYQKLYPETAVCLRAHADSYFTNDLIYEMVAGLLNIKSNHYDETNSLASPLYKYTPDTLTTCLGEKRLSEDTDDR